jgi:allantoinase
LTFAAADVPDGATELKCAPPIREARHRDALWQALDRRVLDLVATDHSPAPEAMKCRGDFMRAWGGIASLELSLAAVWSQFCRRAGLSGPSPGGAERFALEPNVTDLARWMSDSPAALARLNHRKGRIAVDYDADLVVWDPDAEFTVDPHRLQQRHKLTPYAERTLRGAVRATYLRGERVWDGTSLTAEAKGRLL